MSLNTNKQLWFYPSMQLPPSIHTSNSTNKVTLCILLLACFRYTAISSKTYYYFKQNSILHLPIFFVLFTYTVYFNTAFLLITCLIVSMLSNYFVHAVYADPLAVGQSCRKWKEWYIEDLKIEVRQLQWLSKYEEKLKEKKGRNH